MEWCKYSYVITDLSCIAEGKLFQPMTTYREKIESFDDTESAIDILERFDNIRLFLVRLHSEGFDVIEEMNIDSLHRQYEHEKMIRNYDRT